jgi:hypothetical protein
MVACAFHFVWWPQSRKWFAFLKVKVRGWVKKSSEDMAREVPHAGPTLSVTGSNHTAGKRPHSTRSTVLGPRPLYLYAESYVLPSFLFTGQQTPRKIPHRVTPSHHATPVTSTLAMSDPLLDLPEMATYSVDPNKQCGVVKSDGNRCTTHLSCRIHGEVEKRAVNRPKKYETLLERQLCFGIHPSTHHAGQPRLAPVFDPDTNCGVDLPTGEPCTQDVLYCDTHTLGQQSTAQGRSVDLEDVLDIGRANAFRSWEKSGSTSRYNPDTDCGAPQTSGYRCQGMLSCNLQTLKVKRAVLRVLPFQNKFNTLLLLQLSHETAESRRCKVTEKGQDGQKDHISSRNGKGRQESGGGCGTGHSEIDAQGASHGSHPVTPSRPPRGNIDTSSPNDTPTAPSPETPRDNASSLSLDTSDGEQFTPTSSKVSFHDDTSNESHEHKLNAWEIDLATRETQLQLARAKLDDETKTEQLRQDQATQDRHKAQLYDQDREMRRNEKLVYEQHCESRRNEKIVYEQHCESRRNELLVYDQHLENHRNEQVLRDQDKEIRHNAQLIYEQYKEHRRKAQVLYEQDRAELDRRVHELSVTELSVTRLRLRAQRADELELALNTQLSQKASMLQSLERLKASLQSRGPLSRADLMQGLQKEIKALRSLRSSHQQPKFLREASINRLQRQINALFE